MEYKCTHEECPYKDCNYYVNSTGKYRYERPQEPWKSLLPQNEKEVESCIMYLDI